MIDPVGCSGSPITITLLLMNQFIFLLSLPAAPDPYPVLLRISLRTLCCLESGTYTLLLLSRIPIHVVRLSLLLLYKPLFFSFLPPSENGGRTCIYWLRVTYCMYHRLAAEVPINNSFRRFASTPRVYDQPHTLIARSRIAAPGSPGCYVRPAAP